MGENTKQELHVQFKIKTTSPRRLVIYAQVETNDPNVKNEMTKRSFIEDAKECVPSLEEIYTNSDCLVFRFSLKRMPLYDLQMLNKTAETIGTIIAALFNIAQLNRLLLNANDDLKPMTREYNEEIE